MRVLHLLKTSQGATWALRQIRELIRLGVDIHVALPAGGKLVDEYWAAGASVHEANYDLPVRSPWRYPDVARSFRALVASVKPDLIHSHFVGTTMLARMALGSYRRLPLIFQVPGPLHLEHSAFARLEIAMAGPRDFWIGSCLWICRAYERMGIDRRRIGLAYYGLDVSGLTPGRPGRIRKELGLGEHTGIVGMVAYMYAPKRFLAQWRGLKGHEDLIDAVAIRLSRGDDIVCVMVGGAWDRAESYERRVRRYAMRRCGRRVVFLGTRNDVADLYADMDVVVHPSHSESVGGAAESQLLAVPTVASRVGGLPDLVEDGRTGWLVPPKRPDLLAEAIAEALRNPEEAQTRAAAGHKLASELFDIRFTAGAVHDVYQQILISGEIQGPGQRQW